MIETDIQAQVRLAATKLGWRVWRNNVGVLMDKRGIPIRYGLANDSKKMNEEIKSADLIGVRPVLILPEHVGHTIGQFVSLECKRPGWKFKGNDEREQAQLRWANLVNGFGGYAVFTTGDI